MHSQCTCTRYAHTMQSANGHGLCTLRAAMEPLPMVPSGGVGQEALLATLPHVVRARPSATTVCGCWWALTPVLEVRSIFTRVAQVCGGNRWSRRREGVPGIQELPCLPSNSQALARASHRTLLYTGLSA